MRFILGIPSGVWRLRGVPSGGGHRPNERSGGALAGGFVEQDGGGSSGVEGFDRRGHGDTDTGVGGVLDLFGKALPFVADEQSYGAAPVDLPGSEERFAVVVVFVGTGGHDVDICGAKLFDGGRGGVTGEHGEMKG